MTRLLGHRPHVVEHHDRTAALTLDDGLDFDFDELVHPTLGPQPSVQAILRAHAVRRHSAVHATTFVIASPQARRQIADREMLGHRWIGDHWWPAAVAGGLLHVGNHSWDHLSPSVSPVGQREGRTGSFVHVDSFADADLQVRQAREFIVARAPNPGAALFAYPYGEANRYLVDEYFPRHGAAHGTLAAFTAEASPLHAGCRRWTLPRYTCGRDWRSPEEFARIVGP
jgi:peptidoglycan/xylan/chitin deacetylase (PgdA/CDA1 family)